MGVPDRKVVGLAPGHRPASTQGLARIAVLSTLLLLAVYTALRPGRSSTTELEGWATRLDELGATRTAAFVREAAAAYADRGLAADG